MHYSNDVAEFDHDACDGGDTWCADLFPSARHHDWNVPCLKTS